MMDSKIKSSNDSTEETWCKACSPMFWPLSVLTPVGLGWDQGLGFRARFSGFFKRTAPSKARVVPDVHSNRLASYQLS